MEASTEKIGIGEAEGRGSKGISGKKKVKRKTKRGSRKRRRQ